MVDSPRLTPREEGPGDAAVDHVVSAQDPATDWEGFVHRIVGGDRQAEAELVQRFYAKVRAMALARLRGAPAAIDITQDTMLAVLQALRAGRLREPARLSAFVLSTARNLISGHQRQEARNREILQDPPEEAVQIDPPSLRIDNQRRLSLVGEALDRLKPLDRRILHLTLVEGMTSREISPIVGLSRNAVRTRRARAVKAITRRIERVTQELRPDYIAKSGLRP